MTVCNRGLQQPLLVQGRIKWAGTGANEKPAIDEGEFGIDT